MAGSWIVTDESRRDYFAPAQQQAKAMIVLKPNGEFDAVEIPADLLYVEQKAESELVTGNGTWRLATEHGSEQVDLVFIAITVGRHGSTPFGTRLSASGRGQPMTLFYFRGDPDQARRVEFKRAS